MTDPISFLLYDPVGFVLLISFTAIGCAGAALLAFRPKKVDIAFERVKVGFLKIQRAKLKKKKDESDYTLELKDGRKFVVPKEKIQDAEIMDNPKSIKIPKGIIKLFPIENGQIVSFNGSLTQQPNPLLDNETVSGVINRSSARRLSKIMGALANSWTMLILAVGMGLAVGYIMYPQFNHPGTVIEYCRGAGQNLTCGLTP